MYICIDSALWLWVIDAFILLMCFSAFSKFSIINEFFIVKNAMLEKDN